MAASDEAVQQQHGGPEDKFSDVVAYDRLPTSPGLTEGAAECYLPVSPCLFAADDSALSHGRHDGERDIDARYVPDPLVKLLKVLLMGSLDPIVIRFLSSQLTVMTGSRSLSPISKCL